MQYIGKQHLPQADITSVYHSLVITSTNAQHSNGYSICHEPSRPIINYVMRLNKGLSGLPSVIQRTTTSYSGNNICHRIGTTSAYNTTHYHIGNIMKKNIFPNSTNKIMKVNIFCRPEEAMMDSGKSLCHNKNIFCFIERFGLSST